MKRDMDLIRLLLLRVESGEPPDGIELYSEAAIIYHDAQLIEAGLIRGIVRKDANGLPSGAVALDLTWAGHEFLAAARSQTVWKKTMGKLKELGLDVSLTTLKEFLGSQAKEMFGLRD